MHVCVCGGCMCVCVFMCTAVCVCMVRFTGLQYYTHRTLHTVTQLMSTWGERLMSGNTPFLRSLMRSLRAEVVPMAQQEPQSGRGERKPTMNTAPLPAYLHQTVTVHSTLKVKYGDRGKCHHFSNSTFACEGQCIS